MSDFLWFFWKRVGIDSIGYANTIYISDFHPPIPADFSKRAASARHPFSSKSPVDIQFLLAPLYSQPYCTRRSWIAAEASYSVFPQIGWPRMVLTHWLQDTVREIAHPGSPCVPLLVPPAQFPKPQRWIREIRKKPQSPNPWFGGQQMFQFNLQAAASAADLQNPMIWFFDGFGLIFIGNGGFGASQFGLLCGASLPGAFFSRKNMTLVKKHYFQMIFH